MRKVAQNKTLEHRGTCLTKDVTRMPSRYGNFQLYIFAKTVEMKFGQMD